MNTQGFLKVAVLYTGFMTLILAMCILIYSFFTSIGAVVFSALFVVGLSVVALEVWKEEKNKKHGGGEQKVG